ncbi:hypothetical protein SF83666_a42310 (plasmid) [Sinorhizobium fredii CCBAU 83666]|nr:hypothetical protein SF83666_a42310 [Sinorhizobium fredii CCBAU 83666]
MLVQRLFLGAGRIVGDHRYSAFVSDGVTQAITVIGGIGHADLGGEALDQRIGLRRIALR